MQHVMNLINPDSPVFKQISTNHQDNLAIDRLKDHFINRKRTGFYFANADIDRLIKVSHDEYPDQVSHVIRVAEELVEHTFLFQEPWDMERTNVPVTFSEAIDWGFMPEEDVEWTYMLNRHRFLIPLGQAYVLTGDERYAETFHSLVSHWISANPKETAPYAWRTIDVGLRISHWLKALFYFKESKAFTSTLFAQILASLHEQGQYLIENFSEWNVISNWGVLESKGLFELSIFGSDFKAANRWYSESCKRLEQTINTQVWRDGMHWEQSPMYHNEVLLSYLAVIKVSKLNDIKQSQALLETTKKMAYATMYMTKPNYHQPMKGDSDSIDTRDVITKSAFLFNDPVLKTRGFVKLDFENLWDFGPEAIYTYKDLKATHFETTSIGFKNSGNFFMRSGWNSDDLYMYFHCGPLGGGHGHADLLHIDVHAYGKALLSDSGRFTYSDVNPLRSALKRSGAHNTTQVDELDFTECQDSWSYGRIAQPIYTNWVTEQAFDYIEASHDGYEHLPDPVKVKRIVIFVKPSYWLLIDQFTSKETHLFTQNFNFPPGKVTIDNENRSCSTQNTDAANLHIMPLVNACLTVTKKKSYTSFAYNEIEPSEQVTYQLQSAGTTVIPQLLYPTKADQLTKPEMTAVDVCDITGKVVDKDQAEAFKLFLPALNETHLFLICKQPPALHNMSYLIEGTQVFGEIVLIKRTESSESVIVIK
ncbi:MAG: alginate lyase family protein [Bacillota bacterium]